MAVKDGLLWGRYDYREGRFYGGVLFRTVDNGLTWQSYGVNVGYGTGTEMVDCSVATADIAWVLIKPVGNIDRTYELMRTTSGPNGFRLITATMPADLTQIHFFDSTTGIALAAPVTGATCLAHVSHYR